MNENLFIGQDVDNGYIIQEFIGSGCVGDVFKAYNSELKDTRAIKFIPAEKVKTHPNWQAEITKVTQLQTVDGVVKYLSKGEKRIGENNYQFIMWEFVNGVSLRDLIKSRKLSMQMLVDVITQSLAVFHACKAIGIQHADFHAGNIIIENPNPLYIDESTRKVRITDFGCGKFSQVNDTPPMDDYDGLAKIIQESLQAIDFHTLEVEDRNRYRVLKEEYPKFLHETNHTEGDYVRNPKLLREKLYQLFEIKDYIPQATKSIGDFLAAELIGERYEEWQALFVPKFLAVEDLLDKNICVLTGLRGCGKTMMFRRLSFDLQNKLGPAGIYGEDNFIGFYLNARTLAEAYPWLPEKMRANARKQVLNFFNVKWCIEILKWLRCCVSKEQQVDVSWLHDYFREYLPDSFFTGTSPDGIIKSVIEACTGELMRSKLEKYFDRNGSWPFCEYSFLSDFLEAIFKHHGYGRGKAVYFFLDDYSSPMIGASMQKILNPVIFRRDSNIFFKVSTESTESFCAFGLNGKVLENGPDYKLVDLGSELLKDTRRGEKTEDIITSIFEKRISRSSLFSGKNITLLHLLGETQKSNNELATEIRANDKQTLYYGSKIFCNLWSSDIRELIKVLSEMISVVGEEYITSIISDANFTTPIIPQKTQDGILRDTGGRFLNLLGYTTNPNHTIPSGETEETYGSHLINIVTAFQTIAYSDLKNKDSKNQGASPPKQARKIELTSINGDLDELAKDYYAGLIRYGVLLQDYRAKSVRGTPAKRLYLRSMLIPYCRLTFSKRDSITMDWADFNRFLMSPQEYAKEYIKKNGSSIEDQVVMQGFNETGGEP